MTKKEKANDNLITMSDVMARRGLKEDYSVFHSQIFDKDFKIDKIKPSVITDIMKTDDEEYEKYKQLIYNSCSFFRQKELLKEFDCEIPYDVVSELLEDNYAEIFEFGNLILKKYGFTQDRLEKVKK